MECRPAVIVLIVLVILLLYFTIDGRFTGTASSEHMISEPQYVLLGRGFNAPLADDYKNLDIIYQAENADRTSDISTS
jgi:hypothetical protein